MSIVLPFTIQTPNGQDYVVPDEGTAFYTVRGHDGAVIGNLFDVGIETTSDTTEAVITIALTHNIKTRSLERRMVSWTWRVGGRVFSDQLSYWLIDRLMLDATPDEVRALLGVNRSELPDDEIDLIAAYYELAEDLGGTLLADALKSGNFAAIKANRAIVTKEALRKIPSLRLRAARAEKSGSESFTRFDIDWEKLKEDLGGDLQDQIGDLVPLQGSTFLVLAGRPDPFNPYDGD